LSFKYYDFSGKYSPLLRDGTYMGCVLDRFKEICRLSRQELVAGGDTWRCHKIPWDKTADPAGFASVPPSQLQDVEAMQISLGLTDGRMHGIFVDDIFFVVWFDAQHRLWPAG